MIHPSHLRIGNHVLATKGGGMYPAGIIEVEEILSDGVNRINGDHTAYKSEVLEGIPMATELSAGHNLRALALLALEGIPMGTEIFDQRLFPPSHARYMKGVIYLYKPGAVSIESGWAVGVSDFWNDDRVKIIGFVDFVHQFQNLFFAITREELPLEGSALIKRGRS